MSELRMHGLGGQGTVMAAEIMANAFVYGGKYSSVFPSFGIERRGSEVFAFVRFGENPARERTRVYEPEIVVMLDQSLAENPASYDGFETGGIIIVNTSDEKNIIDLNLEQGILATVDALDIALEEIGLAIPNTCMLGAFARATGLVEMNQLRKALELYFAGERLAKNIRCMERGFNEVKIVEVPQKSELARKVRKIDLDSVTIAEPKFTSSFEAAWADTDEQLISPKTGDWRYRRPILDEATCRLCGWCSIYCPVGCIQVDENGYYRPDLDYCKGCGVCAQECPAQALKMIAEEVV